MYTNKAFYNDVLEPDNAQIVSWDKKYAIGIELIDRQHKELISLTNKLFQACLSGNDTVNASFKETMSYLVDYVRFHFAAEKKLQEWIKYPKYHEHKKLHDDMIILILETVRDYNEGRKFVPNNFVRSLKDWILSHIAVYDRDFAAYSTNRGLVKNLD